LYLGGEMKHIVGMALTVLLLVTATLAQDTMPTDAGVYYVSGGKYTLMKRACNSGMKAMSLGRRGKFIYPNPSGSIQIDEHRPTFVFIGADQTPTVRVTFALTNMTAKKKDREVEFAIGGVMKNTIDTKIVHDGSVLKVVPTSDIPAGEYLLGMYQGVNDPTIANLLGCGYDFSVK
jgi:hypothetical protein